MAEEPLGADSNRDLGKRKGTQVPSSSPSDLGLGGGGGRLWPGQRGEAELLESGI